MVAVTTMAKKQVGRPRSTVKRPTILALRGVAEYKTWLDEFAHHVGLSLADTVGMSLQAFAESKGFRPPPKR